MQNTFYDDDGLGKLHILLGKGNNLLNKLPYSVLVISETSMIFNCMYKLLKIKLQWL